MERKKVRIIVAGSRDFTDYEFLKGHVLNFIEDCDVPDEEIEIVSGKARGADTLGEKFAGELGYTVKEFPADWEQHGKKAGPIRNQEMADYATHLIAFYRPGSRGTKDMIRKALNKDLIIRVITWNK